MGSCCAYSVFIKLIGLLTVIFSMILLAVCGWTLANTFRPLLPLGVETGKGGPMAASEESNSTLGGERNDSVTAATGKGKDVSTFLVEGSSIGIPGGMEDVEDSQNENVQRQLDEIMSPKFKNIVQLCSAVAISIGLFQLLVSMIILCSSQKRIRGKAKFWQLSTFIIILILLMCILVPMSYNREKDKFRGAFTFGKYIKTQVTNFINHSSTTLSSSQYQYNNSTDTLNPSIVSNSNNYNDPESSTNISSAILSFLMRDLNSYYCILTLDTLVLFNFLFISCCCVQCRAKNYYQSV